jgi:hypothetical protein
MHRPIGRLLLSPPPVTAGDAVTPGRSRLASEAGLDLAAPPRQVRWKEWKTTAAKRHNLRIRALSESSARKWGGSSKGCWRVAGSRVLQVCLPNSYWNRLGLKTLSQTWQRLKPTA